MSTFTGTHLDKNPFETAMDSSIPNASEISQALFDSLNGYTGGDARITAEKNYYKTFNDAFQPKAATQLADLQSRIESTRQVVITLAGMKTELHSWILQIYNVYPEGSETANRLLEGGSTSFYSGSRAKRLIRVNALVTAIGADSDLADLKTQVQNYANALANKKSSQTSKKTIVRTDTTEINGLRDACTKAMWYVYAGLLRVFIDNPSEALAFFPMQLIYQAANQKRYQLLVPAHSRRKICIHLFKIGETITMINNLTVDLKIGLAQKANSTSIVWYTLAAGATLRDANPNILGNIAFKYIMVENDDLTTRGDITFIINAA